jgi:hypothetical protein
MWNVSSEICFISSKSHDKFVVVLQCVQDGNSYYKSCGAQCIPYYATCTEAGYVTNNTINTIFSTTTANYFDSNPINDTTSTTFSDNSTTNATPSFVAASPTTTTIPMESTKTSRTTPSRVTSPPTTPLVSRPTTRRQGPL